MSALLIEQLHKSFSGVPVLQGVTLDIPAGGITAILGPSGCGKTTLLRLVAGFLRPDAGCIRIDERDVSGPGVNMPPEDRRLGYLAQEGALFPHLTVAQNVAFGLPRKARRDRDRLRQLLELVSLDTGLGDRFPHELSGGQQQRVALARTLAPEPKLVLLDEPFSALDASLRAETRATVAGALAATGVTTLLVTHDQAEALSFADTIAVMRSGLLVQVGDPQEVYDNPIDLSTADFIGDTCTVTGTILGDTASGPFGDIAVRRPPDGSVVDGPALLMFRPEQLRIHHGNSHGIPSIIHSVAYFGHDCVVTAELCGDGSAPRATVTCRLLGADRLEAGDRVRIGVIGPALAYPLPTDSLCRTPKGLNIAKAVRE